MSIWNAYEKFIDFISDNMGRVGWILILYCMIFGVTDVFLRYVLASPSLWISTTLQVAMVILACVGGINALNDNAFVKLDLFYADFSAKKKAVCDLLTAIFSFMFLTVLIWKGIDAAKLSIMLNQHTPTSVPIPIYPLKVFFPITGVIMLLIVIKKMGNDVRTLMSKDA